MGKALTVLQYQRQTPAASGLHTCLALPGQYHAKVPLSACLQVNRIPVVHGSALFQLGETQSLATATVGSPEDEQRMQGLLDADNRRLIVHFSFPPYAVNNVSLSASCNAHQVTHQEPRVAL